jgi:hypothetical protein
MIGKEVGERNCRNVDATGAPIPGRATSSFILSIPEVSRHFLIAFLYISKLIQSIRPLTLADFQFRK